MKSIEDIMNEIDDGTVETEQAVRTLKMLYRESSNGDKFECRK